MSADELEIKRIAFFLSVGNAASRSVVITVGLGISPPGWEENVEKDHDLGG